MTKTPLVISLFTAPMGMANPLSYLKDFGRHLQKENFCNLDKKETTNIFLMAAHPVPQCEYPTIGGGVSFDPSGLERLFKNEIAIDPPDSGKIGKVPWEINSVAEFMVFAKPGIMGGLTANTCNKENMNEEGIQKFIVALVRKIVDDKTVDVGIDLKMRIKKIKNQIKSLQDELKTLEDHLELSSKSSKKSKVIAKKT